MQFDKIIGCDGDVVCFRLKNGMYGIVNGRTKSKDNVVGISEWVDTFTRFAPYLSACTAEDIPTEILENAMYNIANNEAVYAYKKHVAYGRIKVD